MTPILRTRTVEREYRTAADPPNHTLVSVSKTHYPDRTTSAYFSRLKEKASPAGTVHMHYREEPTYKSVRFVESPPRETRTVEKVTTVRREGEGLEQRVVREKTYLRDGDGKFVVNVQERR